METKTAIAMALLGLLFGGLIGAVAFTNTKTVSVPVTVEKRVEVPVVHNVTVFREDTTKLDALQARFDSLKKENEELVTRYEMLSNRVYDANEVSDQLRAIKRAEDELATDWKQLFLEDDYRLSQVSFEKFYDEDARINTVKRFVDGKRVDYDKAVISFTAKVRYEDDEGDVRFDTYDVHYTWDLNSDGVERAIVNVDPE